MLTFQHLSKTYGSGLAQNTALKDVSADISCGEMVALCGPSGSGKSTMMNLIGCLDRPSSGVVKIASDPTSELNDNQLTSLRSKAIGFVFQQFHLLPQLSALDNVIMPMIYAGVPAAERRRPGYAAGPG